MEDDDNALILGKRGVIDSIASKLAPTGLAETITRFVLAAADYLPHTV